MKRSYEYGHGMQAAIFRLGSGANPYRLHSPRWHEWYRGYSSGTFHGSSYNSRVEATRTRRTGTLKNCQNCGNEMYCLPCKADRKYCGRKCRLKGQYGIERTYDETP